MRWASASGLLAVALALSGCSTMSDLVGLGPSNSPSPADAVPPAAELNDENSRELYLVLVEQLRQGGRSRAALAYLDDYEQHYPGDPEAQVLRAGCLSDVGEYAEAEAIYRTLLDGDQAAAAHSGLGQIAAARNDWPAALAEFQQAVTLEPTEVRYLNNLGLAQMRTAAYERAIFTLSQAVELAPGNAQIRNNLILVLHVSGRDEAARALLARIEPREERRAVEEMLRTAGREVRPPAGATTS